MKNILLVFSLILATKQMCMERTPTKIRPVQSRPAHTFKAPAPIFLRQIPAKPSPTSFSSLAGPILPPGTIIQKDKTKPENDTILLAIDRGDLDAVNSFLATGVDVNTQYKELYWEMDRFGNARQVIKTETNNYTLLMLAATKGKTEIVKRLLAIGADPNLQNFQQHTALTLCNKHTDTMRALLEGKADPNIKTFLGNTALIYAISKREKNQITLLLEFGADITIKDNYGFCAQEHALMAGKEFVNLLSFFTAKTAPSEQMSEIEVNNTQTAELADEC